PAGLATTLVVGAPVEIYGNVYDCSLVLHKGVLRAIVPDLFPGAPFAGAMKTGSCGMSVSYAGFDDVPVSTEMIFAYGNARFAIVSGNELAASPSPDADFVAGGAGIILCPSASVSTTSAEKKLRATLAARSSDLACAYIHAAAGYGESTGEGVYDGSLHIFECDEFLESGEQFLSESNVVVADLDLDRISVLGASRNRGYSALTPADFELVVLEKDSRDTDFENTFARIVEPLPFAPVVATEEDSALALSEALEIQSLGRASRMKKIGARKAVIGVSGGLDSSLALIVAYLAAGRAGLEPKDIVGITMPGYGTSGRTKTNADELMEGLGITSLEIPIGEACHLHLAAIGHPKDVHGAAYENAQARERTQILMDYANSCGGLVVGTGDLSEAALGWCTYNGDHMSMYGVNSSVPKTLVRKLVAFAAGNIFTGAAKEGQRPVSEILMDIVATPISPELVPGTQNTEDIIGPYELHDFFLYNLVRYGYSPEKIVFLAEAAFDGKGDLPSYDRETIEKWLKLFLKRFFNNQFKRSCSPEGPNVTGISLSPRGSWAMAGDVSAENWINSL
ncbi:MAG: NAD(+) synthase, partial [Bacteroidales bacterium]|nr:NAD(+) synthase [Bacteroidales bacterium]